MCVHGELCSGAGVVECMGSPSLRSMSPSATAWVNEGGYLPWWYEFARLACRRSTTAGLVFVGVAQRRIGRLVIAVLDVSRTFGTRGFLPKAPSWPGQYQRSSRPYATAAMSHNTAMMRNIAPIGSRSNIREPPRFDAGRARAGCGGRAGVSAGAGECAAGPRCWVVCLPT